MQVSSLRRHADHRPLALCSAPATCGEFIQGALDGRDFLINCPIDLYSTAVLYAGDRAGLAVEEDDRYEKLIAAVDVLARRYALALRHSMVMESRIPRGKGMASSTADITAALKAVCATFHVDVPDRVFASILAEVEPSDCVHIPGIAQVNHLTGELVEQLPAPDGLRVLVVDCGGAVDTLAFDRERARSVYRQCADELAYALALVQRGLRHRDLMALGEGATRSARISQRVLEKPQFEALHALGRELGALGVNCAHSGTVLGVLHRGPATDKMIARIDWHFRDDIDVLGDFAVIGGGAHEW